MSKVIGKEAIMLGIACKAAMRNVGNLDQHSYIFQAYIDGYVKALEESNANLQSLIEEYFGCNYAEEGLLDKNTEEAEIPED